MWQLFALARARPNLARQDELTRAGSALACAYSSSDEFEAAVLRAKAAARAFGWRRNGRLALFTVIAVAVAAVLLFLS